MGKANYITHELKNPTAAHKLIDDSVNYFLLIKSI